MIRRLLLLTTAAALVLGVLPAAAAPAFQALGCYTDVAGDAAGVPAADLNRLCARYEPASGGLPSVVVFDFRAEAAIRPLQDAAWSNPRTALSALVDVDEDGQLDATATVARDGDAVVVTVTDGQGDPIEGCNPIAQPSGGRVLVQLEASCLDEPDAIGLTGVMAYEPTAGAAVIVDRVPDDGFTAPLPPGDEPPVCDNAQVEPGQLTVRRLACGGVITGTEPISQAVATSQFVFDDPATPVIDPYGADWAVIARDDDFADALAGSSLSFGQGPLLFTYSPRSAAALGVDPARLADITQAELLRTLRRGATVYLMGGAAALDPGLDQELIDLGYEVVRFAGTGREGTARLVSQEVDLLVQEFSDATGFPNTNMVLIATGSNWPDAVVAGSVGAFWGMPILLVNANPPVHPETLAALDELRPDYIHVIGGTTVITNDTGRAIGDHARGNGYGLGRPGEDLSGPPWGSFCGTSFVCRWGGSSRVETGGNVGQLNRDMVGRFGDSTDLIPDNPQQYAVAVSLGVRCRTEVPAGSPCPPEQQDAAFPYTLAAATVSGRFGGAVFVPTDNGQLKPEIVNFLCNTPTAPAFVEDVEELVVVGGPDLLGEGFVGEVRDLVQSGCP